MCHWRPPCSMTLSQGTPHPRVRHTRPEQGLVRAGASWSPRDGNVHPCSLVLPANSLRSFCNQKSPFPRGIGHWRRFAVLAVASHLHNWYCLPFRRSLPKPDALNAALGRGLLAAQGTQSRPTSGQGSALWKPGQVCTLALWRRLSPSCFPLLPSSLPGQLWSQPGPPGATRGAQFCRALCTVAENHSS